MYYGETMESSARTEKKYLVITSDDFGVTNAVNRGILKGFLKGVLTSSNLMAPCPWFPQAAKMAAENDLPVGIHLTLTCEWTGMKWGPITRGSSLSTSQGYFFPDYGPLLDKAEDREILDEYRTQIERVISSGISPTHVDSHMLPSFSGFDFHLRIRDLVRQAAGEFGLIYTYDTENGKLLHFDSEFLLSEHDYPKMQTWLSSRKEGYHHLTCHCAVPSPEQEDLIERENSRAWPWALELRKRDLEIILSPEFRKFLENEGFERITIPEMAEFKQRRVK